MTTLTVACLQLEALDLRQAEEALQRALAQVDAAAALGADLLVLPECTYPAYYLQSRAEYDAQPLRPAAEVAALFGDRAARHGVHLVVGLVDEAPSGRLRNAAYWFGPDGQVVGTTSKSFLWHFDQVWFEPAQTYPVFATALGRAGMFVCADGRKPEVVRSLGIQGPRLLIDTTAWVSTGGDWQTLSNPQYEYMMPVRAIENGAWIVVANKVGIEADSVVYCGRSCVVAPDGRRVAAATPDQEEILLATIDLDEAQGAPVARRPAVYEPLTRPTAALPITEQLQAPEVVAASVVRLGAVQLQAPADSAAYLARLTALVETLVRQDARLVVLPAVPAGQESAAPYQAAALLPALTALSARLSCGLVVPAIESCGARQMRTLTLLDAGAPVGHYVQLHVADGDSHTAGDSLPVFETRFGRIGLLINEDGLVPEVARAYMLLGAELLIWAADPALGPLRTIARCRADENKLFAILTAPPGASGHTALFNPAGGFMAAALPAIEQGIAGQMARALTRYKEMAPNTHVVYNRQPAIYGALTQSN
jgi:predicted amidohydrolase